LWVFKIIFKWIFRSNWSLYLCNSIIRRTPRHIFIRGDQNIALNLQSASKISTSWSSMALIMMRRVWLKVLLTETFKSLFQCDTSHEKIGKLFVLFCEDCCEFAHGLFLTHIFRIWVIVDRIFAYPHLHISHLVLAYHVFSNLNWSMNAYQSS